ncbi:MAG TPA: P1 family peptidase [Bacillota bacterium]|jgi:D-aminopeptidase
MAERRKRARDLGINIGRFAPGVHNAITDVPGVRVGHCDVVHGYGRLVPGEGPARTGVTVVVPDQLFQDGFLNRLFAGHFVLASAGEINGAVMIEELGIIEAPIALTNTVSIGVVRDAVLHWMIKRYPSLGLTHDPVVPIVAECDDSYLNDMQGGHIKEEHVIRAIETAVAGPVAEGVVGAGLGMTCFDFKSGIGTASRLITLGDRTYTLGVLVLTNFGERWAMQVLGVPVGEEISGLTTTDTVEGSGVIVVATDAPFLPHHLRQLAKRTALGFGRAGSYASYGSGEFMIAFSTGCTIPRNYRPNTMPLEVMIGSRSRMNPFFQAAIEAVEEAVLNSLLMAETAEGRDGNTAYAIPIDELVAVLRKYGRLK